MRVSEQMIQRAIAILSRYGKKFFNEDTFITAAAFHTYTVIFSEIENRTGLKREKREEWKIVGYVKDAQGGQHPIIESPQDGQHYLVGPDGKLHS